MLDKSVYRIQTVWRLVDLKGHELLEQTALDTLGYYPVIRQDFQSDSQETISWYLRRREELYQSILPFVGDHRSITLDAASWPS